MNLDFASLFRALAPEACLVFGALVVLAVDLAGGKNRDDDARRNTAGVLASLAVVAALVATYLAGLSGALFGGVLVLDALSAVARAGILVLTLLAIAFAAGGKRLPHHAEYLAIMLLAAAGFTVMAAARQLLVAFLALELASLSLYILAGFDKTRAESAEAALKYFLFGGISAAFLLFGFSLVYGITGSIDLPEISRQLASQPPSILLTIALVMILVAFGFKAAAAPFHLWAPDVYEGAPAPSAALIASASKLAGFTLFVRLLWGGFGTATASIPGPSWLPAAAVIAAVSLLLGNVAALAQSNVRRLLAYSAIAHAGALLLGVLVAGRAGPGPVLYYAATYGIATVGAFGVIALIERGGPCQDLRDLAGLHRRSPLLAAGLAVCVLSLAGIPPLAGFFGKFLVFAEALKAGGPTSAPGSLALLAIALSAVALYYYLLILKQALIAAPPAGSTASIPVPAGARLALFGTMALLLALGVAPSVVLRLF